MDGTNGIPRDAMRLATELEQVLHGVGKQRTGK